MASTVWRGYVSFGLISIPVRLYRAARPERISFRRMYRQEEAEPESTARQYARVSAKSPESETFSAPAPANASSAAGLRTMPQITPAAAPPPVLTPVKQVSVRTETNERVSDAALVKGYEFEKDRFVAIEPEELKSVAPSTSQAMEIQEFVQLAEIDPVYFETSYYAVPEEAGEKAYALLYRSLQTSGLVAIAQFAMHGREHVVVLRPGKFGVLAHTMFFASEVRADEEYHADVSSIGKKELELAQTLVNSLAAPFEPEKYRDTYREKIQALIDRKVKGQPLPAPVAAPRQADVIDIADALRKSLANLKKPAASTTSAVSPENGLAKRPARKSASVRKE
jgi:DNA end-binding protein Ku